MLDLSRLHHFQRHNFEKYGPIWREKLPGLPESVTTTRPNDIEK